MTFTAQQIADFLKGTIEGNPEVIVNNLSKIEEGQPGTLTFLANPKYTDYIYSTKASIVLVNSDFKPKEPINATLIKVADAYKSLGVLLNLVEQSKEKKTGIHPLAFIEKSAQIGENVYIGPFVYVGENTVINNDCRIYPHSFIGDGVSVGENSLFYSGVKIYDNCQVGNNCIIHGGTVIGSDGFGFAPTENGTYDKIAQIGNVIIEDDVEIGANCAIDCATMGSSRILRGAKLDNLVHLAHNVEIGQNTAVAGQVGVAGSTKIGKNCVFGGQVGVAGHITVADYSIFGAKSGVSSSTKKEHTTWMGAPVQEISDYRRSTAVIRNLPALQRTVTELQKEVQNLKKILEKK